MKEKKWEKINTKSGKVHKKHQNVLYISIIVVNEYGQPWSCTITMSLPKQYLLHRQAKKKSHPYSLGHKFSILISQTKIRWLCNVNCSLFTHQQKKILNS